MKKLMMLMLALIVGISAVAQNEDPKSRRLLSTPKFIRWPYCRHGVRGRGHRSRRTGGEHPFCEVSANPNVWMVERTDLDKILKEAELNISGAVNPNQAIQIGQLTGAKILVTGSVFKVKDKTFLIAKVISTETSRRPLVRVSMVWAQLNALSEKLAEQVN